MSDSPHPGPFPKGKGVFFFIIGALTLGLFAFGSADRCGEWPAREARLTANFAGDGALTAGAAREPFALSLPHPVGGYGPLRPTATTSKPLAARALVLTNGSAQLALVTLDVLLITPQLRDEVQAAYDFPVWLIATHTHSGPSGYSTSTATQLAALGRFNAATEGALINATCTAIDRALERRAPATARVIELSTRGLVIPRSGADADRRLTALELHASESPVARLIISAGHPTLIPRDTTQLDGDWPAALAQRFETDGSITLVLQGAGGNASIDRSAVSSPEQAAERISAALSTATPRELGTTLKVLTAEQSLPRPEARRLVPFLLAPVVENALCESAEHHARLNLLQLGDLRLLFVPFEPTLPAGLALEHAAHATRVVGLTDGYGGYVDSHDAVQHASGEAHRQYFPASLLDALLEAAALLEPT